MQGGLLSNIFNPYTLLRMNKNLWNVRNAGLLFLVYYFIHISYAAEYEDEAWFKYMVLLVPVVFMQAGAVYGGWLLARDSRKESRMLMFSLCIVFLVWLYEIYRFVL